MPKYNLLSTCRLWIWEQRMHLSRAAILSMPQLLTHIRHLLWQALGSLRSRFNSQISQLSRIHLESCCRELSARDCSSQTLDWQVARPYAASSKGTTANHREHRHAC